MDPLIDTAALRPVAVVPPVEGTVTALQSARALAERYQMNLVDLAVTSVDPDVSRTVPLHVLEHVCAIPFSFDGSCLRVAITDPQNVRGLDEIRLATRHRVEFFVAAREDVLTELRRLTRASQTLNAPEVEEMEVLEEVEEEDLEADDGISDGPLVRLVNSIVFQAVEERRPSWSQRGQ